jgi:catechol 2,3-dioxygenase-like lactoylglutathione lyase family enzyme
MPFAHLTLATRDVRASARFFESTLHWRPIDRPNNIAAPAAWLGIGPEQELHLIELPDFEPSPFEREYGRHIAITHPRAGFDALKRRLIEAGAELVEPERPTPFARFFFRDPNGYLFEVIEDGGHDEVSHAVLRHLS